MSEIERFVDHAFNHREVVRCCGWGPDDWELLRIESAWGLFP